MRRRAAILDPGRLIAYLISAFILLPLFIVMSTSLTNSNFISFPPDGISTRWYADIFTDQRFLRALWVSVRLALVTCLLSTILATLAALAIERYEFPGKALLSSVLTMPLIIPMVVLAIGSLFLFSTIGIARTMTGLAISHIVITFPYALRVISTALGLVDRDIERSAMVLGASRFRLFFDITVPQIAQSFVAATILTFLISMNNAILAVFIAGPRTETLPLLMFNLTVNDISPAVSAMAGLVVLVTFAFLLLLERLFGLDAIAGTGSR